MWKKIIGYKIWKIHSKNSVFLPNYYYVLPFLAVLFICVSCNEVTYMKPVTLTFCMSLTRLSIYNEKCYHCHSINCFFFPHFSSFHSYLPLLVTLIFSTCRDDIAKWTCWVIVLEAMVCCASQMIISQFHSHGAQACSNCCNASRSQPLSNAVTRIGPILLVFTPYVIQGSLHHFLQERWPWWCHQGVLDADWMHSMALSI